MSQEVLSSYVQMYPDSTVAINLKACNYYRLFNGKAAEVHMYISSPLFAGVILNFMNLLIAQAELKGLQDAISSSFQFAKDLIRHNLVSFIS